HIEAQISLPDPRTIRTQALRDPAHTRHRIQSLHMQESTRRTGKRLQSRISAHRQPSGYREGHPSLHGALRLSSPDLKSRPAGPLRQRSHDRSRQPTEKTGSTHPKHGTKLSQRERSEQDRGQTRRTLPPPRPNSSAIQLRCSRKPQQRSLRSRETERPANEEVYGDSNENA